VTAGARARRPVATALLAALALLPVSCSRDDGGDAQVTARGRFEVAARLLEVPDKFPATPLYHYAYVLKYEVLKVFRGQIGGKVIYVAHYDPCRPRSGAADSFVRDVGGRLGAFRAGDVHRMALEAPVDEHYMGGIINPYFAERPSPIYWAVWTNPADM